MKEENKDNSSSLVSHIVYSVIEKIIINEISFNSLKTITIIAIGVCGTRLIIKNTKIINKEFNFSKIINKTKTVLKNRKFITLRQLINKENLKNFGKFIITYKTPIIASVTNIVICTLTTKSIHKIIQIENEDLLQFMGKNVIREIGTKTVDEIGRLPGKYINFITEGKQIKERILVINNLISEKKHLSDPKVGSDLRILVKNVDSWRENFLKYYLPSSLNPNGLKILGYKGVPINKEIELKEHLTSMIELIDIEKLKEYKITLDVKRTKELVNYMYNKLWNRSIQKILTERSFTYLMTKTGPEIISIAEFLKRKEELFNFFTILKLAETPIFPPIVKADDLEQMFTLFNKPNE